MSHEAIRIWDVLPVGTFFRANHGNVWPNVVHISITEGATDEQR